jgi:hypothetical protein
MQAIGLTSRTCRIIGTNNRDRPLFHGLHGAGPHTELDHTSGSIVNYGGGSFNTNQ